MNLDEKAASLGPSAVVGLPAMAHLLDDDGYLIEVSERWLAELGYRREEVLGKRIDDYLSATCRECLPADTLDRDRSCRDVPCQILRKDGTPLEVVLSASLQEARGGKRWLAILQDVSDSVSREKLQHVLSAISEATSQEPELQGLLALIQAEIGRLMDARNFYVALVHDRDKGTFTIPFVADENPEELNDPDLLIDLSGGFSHYVLRTEQSALISRSQALEMVARGEVEQLGIWAESWLGVPLRSSDGEILGVVAVQSYHDEAAYSENDREALSIISSTIASAISATRAEIERRALLGKLARSEKMEALGRLAGAVAHDLNNVLNAVVGYPDLLLQDLPGNSPFCEPLSLIQDSGEKAAAIVKDLLTLARRGVSQKDSVDLNSVVCDYLESPEHAKLLEHHPRVRVETRLVPELPMMMGSLVHLSKAVMNLVSNAAEAMPEGGSIGITTSFGRPRDSGAPEVRGRLGGDSVLLRVADSGVGIEQEDIERIFEPFYTKKVMGRSGTGLGMTVVWGTVEDHEGSIEISSRQGEGTVIELCFPASRESTPVRSPRLPIADYLGQGETVLVIDDRSDQRDIASRILRRLRYRVETAESGEQAIGMLRERTVDVVMLDMIMDPGIDGLETFRRLHRRWPEIRVIIVSGYSESERVQEAQRLGAGEYLLKPYTMMKLGAAIKRALLDTDKPSAPASYRLDSGAIHGGKLP